MHNFKNILRSGGATSESKDTWRHKLDTTKSKRKPVGVKKQSIPDAFEDGAVLTRHALKLLTAGMSVHLNTDHKNNSNPDSYAANVVLTLLDSTRDQTLFR